MPHKYFHMKKLLLFALLVVSATRSDAQVVSLYERFNTSCAILGANYPNFWSEYDIYSSSIPSIAWACGPTDGRSGTAGIECDNFDGTTYYVDTAWLFTPQLNLSHYTGNIYLQFDTRFASNAGRLAVLISNTYIPGAGRPDLGQTWYDVTSASTPIIGGSGSNTWQTQQIDLTPYAASPMYVAFRYTSDVTGSGKWIIDNVLTTQQELGVAVTEDKTLPLTVIGHSTPGNIEISYGITAPGQYDLSIYDMVGRQVHKETISAHMGAATYTISGISLHSGMYLIKMGNDSIYGTAKVVIP